MPSALQLLDDGNEKRHMGSVVKIDPYLRSPKGTLRMFGAGIPGFFFIGLFGDRGSPETSHLPRERVPELPRVFRSYIFEKVRIVTRRIFFPGTFRPIEVHIIRMRIQERHAPRGGDPIELFFPDPVIIFAQDHEKAMILSQSIGKLDIAARIGCVGGKKREYGANAGGLRLERVRIERGTAMLDVQLPHKGEVSQHGRGCEARRSPFFQIIVYFRLLPIESRGALEKLPIVAEAMNSDFKAGGGEAFAQILGGRIIFGNEVESRSEAHLFFQGYEPRTFFEAFPAVHIVVEDEGEFLVFRPAFPILRLLRSGRVYRPLGSEFFPFLCGDTPSARDLNSSRDDWLDDIKKI